MSSYETRQILVTARVVESVAFLPIFATLYALQLSLLLLYAARYRAKLLAPSVPGIANVAGAATATFFAAAWLDFRGFFGLYPARLDLLLFGLGALACCSGVNFGAFTVLASTGGLGNRLRARLKLYYSIGAGLYVTALATLYALLAFLPGRLREWCLFAAEMLFALEWGLTAWNTLLAIRSSRAVLDRLAAVAGGKGFQDKSALKALVKWQDFLLCCKAVCVLVVFTSLVYLVGGKNSEFAFLIMVIVSSVRNSILAIMCVVYLYFGRRQFSKKDGKYMEVENTYLDESVFRKLDAIYRPKSDISSKN